MNIVMFIVGFVIFSVYVYFTIWNINTSAKKNREENYPSIVDNIDMDGHGNYGRFPYKESVRAINYRRNKLKQEDVQ